MINEETSELAASCALGVLDSDEALRVQQRLRSGEVELDTEIASFQEVTGALGVSVGPRRPSSGLRGRLFERIAASDSTTVAGKPKSVLPHGLAALARANQMPWKNTPFPGIRSKRLFTNTSDGTTVWLVQMDAGSLYPPHHHTSIEHTYVISGDIIFDGYRLVEGEYQAAHPHTDHDRPITTKNGCTVLIINNAGDEIYPMPPPG